MVILLHLYKIRKDNKVTANKKPAQELISTAVLPYIKGVSEVLCRCLQHQAIRTVFESDTTLDYVSLSTT